MLKNICFNALHLRQWGSDSARNIWSFGRSFIDMTQESQLAKNPARSPWKCKLTRI